MSRTTSGLGSTISTEPMSPPASPMASASRLKVPGVRSSLTRTVIENCALGRPGMVTPPIRSPAWAAGGAMIRASREPRKAARRDGRCPM